MRALAIWCIRQYQRVASPHKGFQCAYRVVTGRDSCSAFAVKSISRAGLFAGVRLIARRFRKCAAVHRRHIEEDVRGYRWSVRRPGYQSGHCDVPVGDCAGDCAEAANVGDCLVYGCDWDYWRRRKREKEQAGEGAGSMIDPSKELPRLRRLSQTPQVLAARDWACPRLGG